MKATDLQKLGHHAAVMDRVAKFKVGQVQSITVQANMLSRNPGNRGEDNVALRIDPSDPRFQTLYDMLVAEADKQSEASAQVISDAGMTPVVDQESVDAYAANALQAKAEFDQLVERNRQKKLLDAALKADNEAKAAAAAAAPAPAKGAKSS